MIRIGVRSFVSAGGGTDADAQAFITAAGITDATQQSAINTLVTDLKGYGVWSKMKAIYPFVGGTSSTHKWNLKDPRDLDAAFRLVFSGGWTHSSTGAKPNGTNGYADTKFNPITQGSSLSNFSISIYNRELASGTYKAYMGSAQSSSSQNYTLLIYINREYGSIAGNGNYVPTSTLAAFTGLKQVSVQGSRVARYFKNGVFQSGTFTMASGYQNSNLYIGASFNNLSFAGYYTNTELALSTISDGLTDVEAANFYTAVQAYQTTLSRNV